MWTDFIANPQSVLGLYHEPPSLAQVDLFNIEMSRDGPLIRLKIGLDEFPSRPSPRWRRIEANAVTLELLLVGAERVRLDGWSTTNVVNIEIQRLSCDMLQAEVSGPTCVLNCKCAYVYVEAVTPYLKNLSRENV
jgi:hypothetical protein